MSDPKPIFLKKYTYFTLSEAIKAIKYPLEQEVVIRMDIDGMVTVEQWVE